MTPAQDPALENRFSLAAIVSPHFAFSQQPGSLTIAAVKSRTEDAIKAHVISGAFDILIGPDGLVVLDEAALPPGPICRISQILWQGRLPGDVRRNYEKALDYVQDQIGIGVTHPVLKERAMIKIPSTLLKTLADELFRQDPNSAPAMQAYNTNRLNH